MCGDGGRESRIDTGYLYRHGKNISRTGYVGTCRELFYRSHMMALQTEPIVTVRRTSAEWGRVTGTNLTTKKRDNAY